MNPAPTPPLSPDGASPQAASLKISVNGRPHEVTAAWDTPVLWVLRDHLDLTGTRFGCGVAQCGACTVHLDGVPIRSCVTPVSEVVGHEVTTIEGLAATAGGAEAGALHAVQQAWIDAGTPQCGYCQSGQIMSAVALLKVVPEPTDAQIDAALSANLCRCATYPRIRQAVHAAAASMRRVGDVR